MEYEAIAMNAIGYPRGTRISCTRWGNVLGSRGSVIHVFRRAREEGKPLPVTLPYCTRFWLTLDGAADFACFALSTMLGGEILIPKLPTMCIGSLARAVAPGCPIRTIGLRPGGEKMHEILINHEEMHRTLTLPNGYLIKPSLHPWVEKPPWTGQPAPPYLPYASDGAEKELTPEEMREMLKEVPEE
jgi:UDP-N-acetylglucosamine 4,6-dehydratase